MKKSFLLFGLMLVCLFGLVGCDMMGGGNNTEPDPDQDEKPVVTTYNVKFYDGKKLIDEQDLEKGAEIVFPEAPEKEGQYFAYWEEDGREFQLELMPASDIELKAHYEEGYTYTFVDYDGTVIKVGHGSPNSTVEAPQAPTRAKEGNTAYTFNGWDKEITKLTENVTYTATYTSKEVVVLTYELDGGNFKYYGYDDVVKDLLQDYNKYAGTSYTVSTMPMGAWECANFHAFFYATVSNQKMNEKWAWLATYLSQVGGINNKAACAALNKYTTASAFVAVNDNYKYAVSYEFRGFITGTKFDANTSFTSSNYETYDLQNGFWKTYNATVVNEFEYEVGKRVVPQNGYKQNYSFGGWYDNPEFNGSALTSVTLSKDTTIYAKWIELTPVAEIAVSNSINEIEKLKTYKLEWSILPSDAGNKAVKFKSSDPTVLSVTATGVITAHANGTANIIITSVLTPSTVTTIPVTVYTPDHFETSYETESYVEMGETIKLNAKLIKRDDTEGEFTWESLDETIATVNNGIVTPVSAGSCAIRCKASAGDAQFDFYVTVLPEGMSNELAQIVKANNSNVVIQYEQGIGDPGSYAYYIDLIGSVSDIHFSPLIVDNTYHDVLKSGQKNYGTMDNVEWICVHYTGNMSKGSDADNNANYFNNLDYQASIHYVTGATNLYRADSNDYRAFAVLNEKYKGWHATTGQMETTWYATGVMVAADDPETPVFGVSANSKYTINGKETSVAIPDRDDGIKVTGNTFQCGGSTCNSINAMGLPYKVVNGQYYLGSTWWGTQQTGKTLSSMGGNTNSIGIESCVDPGSDIVRTWHVTAQLVADLMYRHDLDITRVVGHHFFSGKNCPQPMLEHDLKLWYFFKEMVEAEYQVITTLADYDISMEVLNGEACKANGRISQPLFDQSIQYKVTITNKNTQESQTIVLASLVEGQYSK